MTNLAPDYAADLTAYNKDGLELFIHNDGSVYASQSAIARMINDSNDTKVRRFIDRRFSRVVPLQVQINKGGKRSSLFGVEVIVALAQEYNPDLATRFMEMGANVYLYQLAGYKIGVKVEPKTDLDSELGQAKYIQNLITEKIEQLNYLADKPGLANKLADAHGGTNALEAAKVDFSELCELAGVTIEDKKLRCKYSAMVSYSLMNDTMQKTEKRLVTYKDAKGKTQQRVAAYYPLAAVAHLKNAIGIG